MLCALTVTSSACAAETVLVSTGAVWRYFDAGMEPGPGWQSPIFDDSTWRIGAAQLGYGDGDETTVISRVNTAYFRASFTVANPAAVSSVFVDVWRDDGVIVYINGVEVLRDNMPPFPPNYFTFASGPALDDGQDPVRGNITPGILVAGMNTIAAEVHQSSFTSTDLSFDLMLVVDTAVMNQPPIANNQNVVAIQDTPTPIVLSGSDPDGNPITFILTSLPGHGTLSGAPPNLSYRSAADYIGSDSFTFKVNDGAADSADATVSIQVLPLPNPPDVVAAVGNCSGTSLAVSFDEAVELLSAINPANYLVHDSLGNFVAVIGAALAADQETVTLALDTPLLPARTYILEAAGICDLSGDCLQYQIVPIEFDREPPVLTCSISRDLLWPPNHELEDVGLSASASDGHLQVQVFSDESDSGGDAVLSNGVLQLSSQREGRSDGRIYLIVVTSADACGNVAVCCRTAVAPHDSSQGALDSVKAQAAAAQAQCSPNGSAVTPYRLLP